MKSNLVLFPLKPIAYEEAEQGEVMSRVSAFFVLGAALLTSSAPAQARDATPARPIGDPGNWITSKDYPSEELMRAVAGTTAFGTVVDKDGNATDCTITASSGSTVLDATVCALVKARAHFEPARDAEGRKVAGYYRNQVRWLVPADMGVPFPPKSEAITTISLNDKGVVQDCVHLNGGAPTQPASVGATPCSKYPKGLKMRPYLDSFGMPLAARVLIRSIVDVIPDPGGRGLAPAGLTPPDR